MTIIRNRKKRILRPEEDLCIVLRRKGFYAATEVESYYACRADVLALDKRKKQIIEYEFKRDNQDLKIAEYKKTKYYDIPRQRRLSVEEQLKLHCDRRKWNLKYRIDALQPHKFYFVLTDSLYEKEKDYCESLPRHVGVIVYPENKQQLFDCDFKIVKNCYARKSQVQQYNVVEKYLLNRLANEYVNLLLIKGKYNEHNR